MSEMMAGLSGTGVIEFLSSWIRTIVVVILLLTFAQMLLPRGSFKNTVELVVGLVVVITIVAPFVNTADIEWELQNMRWTLGTEGGSGNPAARTGAGAPGAARGMPNLDSILAEGQALRSAGEAVARRSVTDNLEAQIESLAMTVERVRACEARVTLGENGEVCRVHLAVAIGEGEDGVFGRAVTATAGGQSSFQGAAAGTLSLGASAGAAVGTSVVRVDPVEQVVIGTVAAAGKAAETVPSARPSTVSAGELAERVAKVVSGFYGIPRERIEVRASGVQSR